MSVRFPQKVQVGLGFDGGGEIGFEYLTTAYVQVRCSLLTFGRSRSKFKVKTAVLNIFES